MPPTNPFGSQPPQTPVPGVFPPASQPQTSPATQPVASQPVTSGPAPANQPGAAKTPPKNPNSTQNSLLFSEIRDDMVIMNDGTFRGVIVCKSINFDLMSSTERDGVEYSYQNFLNSLNHPIQILVRSQKVDIRPYIDGLTTIRRNQDNMLLGVLMDDYIDFIASLSQQANIMNKTFFIVVPYYPNGDTANLVEQGKGFFSKLFAGPKNTATKIDSASYQKAKDEIGRRTEGVMSGLFQLGVQCVRLNTKEIGELFYNSYNPDTAVREPLGNFENTATTYVKKGTAAEAMSKELGKAA